MHAGRLTPITFPNSNRKVSSRHHSFDMENKDESRIYSGKEGERRMTPLSFKEEKTMAIVAGNPRKMPDESRTEVVAAGSIIHNNAVAGNNPSGAWAAAPGKIRYFDYNFHSMKKGISSALLDVSLLMANASQLRSVIGIGTLSKYYEVQLTLLVCSITLQIISGLMLMLISRININECDESEHKRVEILNNFLIACIFLLTIVNVFIASFGISADSVYNDSPPPLDSGT